MFIVMLISKLLQIILFANLANSNFTQSIDKALCTYDPLNELEYE